LIQFKKTLPFLDAFKTAQFSRNKIMLTDAKKKSFDNLEVLSEADIEMNAPASTDQLPKEHISNKKVNIVIALVSILLIAAGVSIGILFDRAHFGQTKNDADITQAEKDDFILKNNDNVFMQEIVMSDPICKEEKYRFYCMHLVTQFYKLHAEHWNITGMQDIAEREHPLSKKIMRGEFTHHVDFNDGIHAGGPITAIIHHGNGVKKSHGDIIDEENFDYDDIDDTFGDHQRTCKHIHQGTGRLCFVHSPEFEHGVNGTQIVKRNFALHYNRRGSIVAKDGRKLLIACVVAVVGAALEAAGTATAVVSTAVSSLVSDGAAVATAVGEVAEGAEVVGEAVEGGEAMGEATEGAEGAEEAEETKEGSEEDKSEKEKKSLFKQLGEIGSVKGLQTFLCEQVKAYISEKKCNFLLGAAINYAKEKVKDHEETKKMETVIVEPIEKLLKEKNDEIDGLEADAEQKRKEISELMETVNKMSQTLAAHIADEDKYSYHHK